MAPPTGKSKHFVEWEEDYVSNDRGSRVVHYYLKDRHGNRRLVVVGTEKSLRHMVYVVSNEFLYLLGNSKSISPSSSTNSCSSSSGSMKWRSRREVVDWLCSLLSRTRSPASAGEHREKWPRHNASPVSDMDVSNDDEMNERTNHIHKSKGHRKRKSRSSKEVLWIGTPWTCRKQLTHYQSFCCKGMTISVHDFVYIRTEGKEHHVAYLKDMFEDAKARKFVRVQWFCKTNEVLENIPPPAEHNERELFLASSCQNFNAECVDGLASVLLPEHYQECLVKLPLEATNQLHICYRQFDNDVIKPLDISQLEGYWHQKVLASIDLPVHQSSPRYDLTSDSLDVEDDWENVPNMVSRKGPRKSRNSRRHNVVPSHNTQLGRETSPPVTDGLCRLLACSEAVRDLSNYAPDIEQPVQCTSEKKEENMHGQESVIFDIDDRLELLSQDSGIRGCWFRCKVVGKQLHRLKVWYEDVLNEDESGNLEEWVLASKIASPDKLGIRIPGRPSLRPFPPENKISSNLAVGTAVDAWWNDGWWEGVVIKISEVLDEVHVYFPGENETSVFQLRDLRISRDWVNNCWTELKETLNVAATLVSLHTESKFLQSETLPSRCTSSLPEDKLGILAGCVSHTDSKSSPVPSVAVGEFSESEEVENSNSEKRILEIKEEIGVDLEKKEKEKPMHNLSNAGLLGDLRWKTSKKRSRDATFPSRGNSSSTKQIKGVRNKVDSQRLNAEEDSLLARNKKDPNRRHNSEDVPQSKRLRQEHENLKPIRGYPMGRSLFTTPMPLSNLVMSRCN